MLAHYSFYAEPYLLIPVLLKLIQHAKFWIALVVYFSCKTNVFTFAIIYSTLPHIIHVYYIIVFNFLKYLIFKTNYIISCQRRIIILTYVRTSRENRMNCVETDPSWMLQNQGNLLKKMYALALEYSLIRRSTFLQWIVLLCCFCSSVGFVSWWKKWTTFVVNGTFKNLKHEEDIAVFVINWFELERT